jgi:hypothetical protein
MCLITDTPNRGTVEQSSENRLCTTPPSPHSAADVISNIEKLNAEMKPERPIAGAAETECQNMDTITVTLALELDKEKWLRFQSLVLLSPEGKQKFLADMLNCALKEILGRNPDLLMAYSSVRP